MGSFAASLHVKANDAATVAEALRRLLFAEGYEVTDEEPDGGWEALVSPIRAIHVSAAREGWVSLLDNQGLGSETLAVALSGQQQTHAIQFFVNDSDSWHYQLFYGGKTIDKFDSCPDDEDFDEDDEGPAGAGSMGETINAAEVNRIITERAQQWKQELLQRMPPRIRDMQQRMMTTRQIDTAEIEEFNAWMRSQIPNMMEQFRELSRGMMQMPPPEAEPSVHAGRFQEHLDHLRPLLIEGVTDSRVVQILSEEQTFAEHTLGKFLPLIGIAPLYANLSYAYLEEFTSADLAAKSIQMAEHLKFKKPTGHAAGPFRVVH